MALALPPELPPEVRAEIDEAWGRAQRPLPGGLVLSFEREPALGRAWGVLRSADGTQVESISAVAALAIACGEAIASLSPVALAV